MSAAGVAAGSGLEYRFDLLQHTNTVKAHELLHFAKAQGAQHAMAGVLDLKTDREPVLPKDAATLVLVRAAGGAPPGPDNGLEVFCVERNKQSRFMGGAIVFPGGKLDGSDVLGVNLAVEGDAGLLQDVGEELDLPLVVLREAGVATHAGVQRCRS